MNETMTTAVTAEENQSANEGFTDTQVDHDDWDNMDLSDLTDDENEEHGNEAESEGNPESADQQLEKEPEEGREKGPGESVGKAEEQEEADQPLFELKHLGETKQVDREEVIRLAQKGMDYDHIRGERDTARTEVKRLQEMESFLKELAETDGVTVEDLMDRTRAQVLAQRENLDPSVAIQRVKLDRERKIFEAKKAQEAQVQREQEEANRRRQEDFLLFKKTYPDADPKAIPQEVWDQVRNGASLTHAYTQHENKMLRQEVDAWKKKAETAELNNKNKTRSTGSQKSAGAESQQNKDPIDLDWYDGT